MHSAPLKFYIMLFRFLLTTLLAACQTGLAMPVLFPKLQECLGDTHPKVAEAAQATLMALTTVIVQPETIKIMDNLKKAIVKPSEFTSVCLDQLMETTFVNSVDAASLAMLMPVVARGLKEPSADLNKKAATTAGNVCALVADSRYDSMTMICCDALFSNRGLAISVPAEHMGCVASVQRYSAVRSHAAAGPHQGSGPLPPRRARCSHPRASLSAHR